MKNEESSNRKNKMTAEITYQRAQTALENIDYRMAMKHAQRAAELIPDKRDHLNLVATIAEKLGEYDKAIKYHEKYLKIALATFGEGHVTVWYSRNSLAHVWEYKGEYDKAIDYFEQAIKCHVAIYGEDHSLVNRTRESLRSAIQIKDQIDQVKKKRRIKPE